MSDLNWQGKPPEILIIDDDSSVVITLNKVLRKVGRIRFAPDAAHAFISMSKYRPDLILLDMNLPDLDGLQICAKIKNDANTSDIPVLFITSQTGHNFEEKVFDAGGADFIVKPLNPRVVASRVLTHLNYHNAIRLLKNQANTDSLTNLANRRIFDEQLSVEFRRARRQNESITIAMIDIDEFKKYNDQYGHVAGDDCLKSIALLIQKSAHRPGDLAARYGGEEFALILPCTDTSAASDFIARLMDKVRGLQLAHADDSTHQYVTISVGYCTLASHNANILKLNEWVLVEAADSALYESKQAGRNTVTCKNLCLPIAINAPH
ncbi:Protein-glutamate methylesterase/protein-glutamine glutaminase [Pseudoalteromonas holothuriae]|uniref:diguanylate cyclase n=1 Tax=Pseudoalteromonas holothuriae TaxID=2963714 RepID=A0ABN8UL62_9GAMM|nr:diguanylate cyclase [Pseudoalteromonas sp. CIP111951]CAH9057923.1 Protein-glutamate methylesterase/protein-glutamine glutaminase [Pseudoalteromonas sp. CIP111951]